MLSPINYDKKPPAVNASESRVLGLLPKGVKRNSAKQRLPCLGEKTDLRCTTGNPPPAHHRHAQTT